MFTMRISNPQTSAIAPIEIAPWLHNRTARPPVTSSSVEFDTLEQGGHHGDLALLLVELRRMIDEGLASVTVLALGMGNSLTVCILV